MNQPLLWWYARAMYGICIGIIAIALTACQSPRDADLEQRVLKAKADQRIAATAKASGGAATSAAKAKAAPSTPRVLKSYSQADISRILGKVPGDGTTLMLTITTKVGVFKCILDRDRAPQTVTNVVGLATGQVPWRDPDTGKMSSTAFYKGLTFHRLVQNFLIQTGNPAVSAARGPAWKSKGPGWVLAREHGADDLYEKPGVLGMLDDSDDSHGSQFFITNKRATHLKTKYAPFGSCDNVAAVTKIANAPKLNPEAKKPYRPKVPVVIDNMEVRWTAGR